MEYATRSSKTSYVSNISNESHFIVQSFHPKQSQPSWIALWREGSSCYQPRILSFEACEGRSEFRWRTEFRWRAELRWRAGVNSRSFSQFGALFDGGSVSLEAGRRGILPSGQYSRCRSRVMGGADVFVTSVPVPFCHLLECFQRTSSSRRPDLKKYVEDIYWKRRFKDYILLLQEWRTWLQPRRNLAVGKFSSFCVTFE